MRRRLGGDNDVDGVRHFYLAVACGIITDLLGNNSRIQFIVSPFDDTSRLRKSTVSYERTAFNISHCTSKFHNCLTIIFHIENNLNGLCKLTKLNLETPALSLEAALQSFICLQ